MAKKEPAKEPKSGSILGKITKKILADPGKASLNNVTRPGPEDRDRRGKTPKVKAEDAPDHWAPGNPNRGR